MPGNIWRATQGKKVCVYPCVLITTVPHQEAGCARLPLQSGRVLPDWALQDLLFMSFPTILPFLVPPSPPPQIHLGPQVPGLSGFCWVTGLILMIFLRADLEFSISWSVRSIPSHLTTLVQFFDISCYLVCLLLVPLSCGLIAFLFLYCHFNGSLGGSQIGA